VHYRLIVTRPNGSQFQSSTDPLPDREATGMSALKTLAAARVAFGRKGLALGQEIRDAELGKTVTHESSGYRFRVEEW
jgi:hypothetical protein